MSMALGCAAVTNQISIPATGEVRSLMGEPLKAAPLRPDKEKELKEKLEEARGRYAEDPEDLDNIIWLGRRIAYLGRYWDAIAVYSDGLKLHPDSAKLYRHRGHRLISVRRLDEAVRDLERAASLIEGVEDEVEPDGLPNALNIPTGTNHSNIWYHLGLAYYLQGDLKNAYRCYKECMKFSDYSEDMFCATSHWLYMTCRRMGRDEEAAKVLEPIHEKMNIIENSQYHKLLLMYRGEATPESLWDADGLAPLDSATLGYGIGNYHLYRGDSAKARSIFDRILTGESWAAFGYIAAEAEVHRWEE